jgi:shikimate 5-dehydrogenase
MATDLSPAAARTQSADLLVHKDNRWHAHDTQLAAMTAALETAVAGRSGVEYPLRGRIVVIAGADALAQSLGRELKERGCGLVIASHDREAAHRLAHELGCRYVQFEGLYSTTHEVLIACDGEDAPAGGREGGIHPGYLKKGMTVLDARTGVGKSHLVREAEVRGCHVVAPGRLWLEQVALQARLLTGKEVPREQLAQAAPWMRDEE